jgi:isopenicillin-N N-acyltransferase-like protein
MVTEAGIIGKIGFNSCGVGTCLNAIRILGVDETRLPVHLGLRLALESNTAAEAVEKLRTCGMASSAHVLIADSSTAYGCEFSVETFETLLPDAHHRVVHSNHMLLEHKGVVDMAWLKDSFPRVERISELSNRLVDTGGDPSWMDFSKLFEDEAGLPTAICRKQEGPSTIATLFNIITDLQSRTAVVRVGRPCQPDETINLSL